MQWIEKIIKFFRLVFRNNAFRQRYRTKTVRKLIKILKNEHWQVIDIRNEIDFFEHHLINTINIPNTAFARRYYKLINHKKKILIINSNYRSNLDIYQMLKRHHLKPYILFSNYQQIRNDARLENETVVVSDLFETPKTSILTA